MNREALILLAAGLATLWAWRNQRVQFTAPTSNNTPNATRNSEHTRDVQQSQWSGYAATPPFVATSEF